jgi:hypothetical protein
MTPLRESDHPVDDEKLKKWLKYGTRFNSAVLVALFVQKSSQHSTMGTMAYLGLGSLGLLAVTSAVIGIRFWGHEHNHQFRWYLSRPHLFLPVAAAGIIALVVAFTGIDASDADFAQAPTKGEPTIDENNIKMRNLIVAENPAWTRVLVTIINTNNSSTLLEQAGFHIRTTELDCDHGIPPPVYRLKSSITVHAGRIGGDIIEIASGPLRDFNVTATGTATHECKGDMVDLTVRFPISIFLKPQEPIDLTIEIPRKINITFLGPQSESINPYSKQQDLRQESVFPIELANPPAWQGTLISISVGLTSTGRQSCISRVSDQMHSGTILNDPCEN